MKFKNQIILLILFSFINLTKTQNDESPQLGRDYPGIECGKKNPKNEKDCTKYGTDSEMLCCHVRNQNGKSAFCTLLYQKTAKETFGIKGKKIFSNNEVWSCGNKSFFLSLNIFIVLFSIFFY